MKKNNTVTKSFAISLPAELLRNIVKLAAHPALWLIPVLLFAGVLPYPGTRSEVLAAAFLSAYPLIIVHALEEKLLAFADTLAPADAEQNTETVFHTNGGNDMKIIRFRAPAARLCAAVLALVLLLSVSVPAVEASAVSVSSDSHRLIQPWNPDLRAVAPDQRQGTGIIPADTRESYNAGSCRQLKGNPYLLVIFLDDDDSHWKENQVLTALNENVLPAMDFMEDHARNWGVDLELQTGYYATYGHPDRPVKYKGSIKTYDNGTSKDLLAQAAATLGFSSKEEMHETMMELSGQEQVGYIFMVNKGGRSYSSCYSSRNGSVADYKMEYSVVFSGFTDTSFDSGSDTVTHEVMHMFGAEDYYYPDSRKSLAREYYPRDIMLCAMPALDYFEVGDFTAYTLGWTDRVPEICADPEWW